MKNNNFDINDNFDIPSLEELITIAEEVVKEKEKSRKMKISTGKLGALRYIENMMRGFNPREVNLSYWEENLPEGWYTIDENGLTYNG